MDPEDIANMIIGKLSKLAGKISVIDREVDMQVQLKYFEFSRNFNPRIKKGEIENTISELNSEIEVERQKEVLIMLSRSGDVKAYRALESFEKTAETEIKDWAKLALHESKMIIEGELLGENQIFISTGLGGSGSSLRYFIVLFSNNEEDFQEFQKKVVKNEINFLFKEYNSQLEEIDFIDNYITLVALIPFETPINEVFKRSIEAINEFGNFISFNFLINNSKRMTASEIKELVESKAKKIIELKQEKDTED